MKYAVEIEETDGVLRARVYAPDDPKPVALFICAASEASGPALGALAELLRVFRTFDEIGSGSESRIAVADGDRVVSRSGTFALTLGEPLRRDTKGLRGEGD